MFPERGDTAENSTSEMERHRLVTEKREDNREPELGTWVERVVPLRNGTTLAVAKASGAYAVLTDLGEEKPHLLNAMFDLARGKNIAPETLEALKEAWLVRPDGTLPPMYKAVLVAGHQETPEGTVLVNPIDSSTQETRITLLEHHEWVRENNRRILQELDPPEDDRGHSPT